MGTPEDRVHRKVKEGHSDQDSSTFAGGSFPFLGFTDKQLNDDSLRLSRICHQGQLN